MKVVKVGQTDYTVLVKLVSSTDGSPLTGLDEGDIDIAYVRVETDNDVATVDVTPAALAALTDAHTDWGFEEVSATDHPGLYRLDIADAVFASGAWSAVVTITGTGVLAQDIEFMLAPTGMHEGVNVSQWLGTAPATPTVAGVPEVDVTHVLGVAPGASFQPIVQKTLAGTHSTTSVQFAATGLSTHASGLVRQKIKIVSVVGGSADNAQVERQITAISEAGGVVTATVEAFPGAPADGDIVLIYGDAALQPTTAGRKLDVSSGGEAGIDLANVGSPTTTLNLSGTTVKTATDVEADTADIQSRLPAALAGGRIDASVGAMQAGVINAAAYHADTAVYQAKIELTRDEANTRDEWTVMWFKNGQPVTSGITSPTITVLDRGNSTLVNAASMTQIGTTGVYLYNATGTARITAGEAVTVTVAATIDGGSRSFRMELSRDATA